MSNKNKFNTGMNEAGASSEGLPLVSRMGPVVIKLLLIRGQREENGLKKRTE